MFRGLLYSSGLEPYSVPVVSIFVNPCETYADDECRFNGR